MLFWNLVATFNSAAVCVYVGLSALRLLMFFRFCFILFLTCIEQKEFQEMKGIRGKKALASSEMTAKVARGSPFPPAVLPVQMPPPAAEGQSSTAGFHGHSGGSSKQEQTLLFKLASSGPGLGWVFCFLFFMVLCY